MKRFHLQQLHSRFFPRLLAVALALVLGLGSAAPVLAASETLTSGSSSLETDDALDLVFLHIAANHDAFLEDAADAQAIEGYFDEEVVQYFVEVCMYAEYEGYRGYLMRYEDPVTFAFIGHPDADDMAQVRALVAALNEVPGFPGISEAADPAIADIKVTFSDQASYEAEFSLHVPSGSWGYSSVWFYNSGEWLGEMNATNIWISDDAWPRRDRNSVIAEEFIQGLGMLNDPDYGYYSIFEQNSNECDWPSQLDWAVVYLLYHPTMSRFASEEEARQVAMEILDSWK